MDQRWRIGHAERERAAEELSQHYADGRLDHDEYTERLDAAWTARTHDDLRILFADLPRSGLVMAPRAAVPVPRRRSLPLWWRVAPVLVALLLLVTLLD